MECKRSEPTNNGYTGKTKRNGASREEKRDVSPTISPEFHEDEDSKRQRKEGDNLREFPCRLLEFYLYGHNTDSVRPLKETELTTSSIKVKYPQGMLPCESSMPGCRFGVCCSRHIPVGTWIGPYEGEVIRPEELTADRDNSHMWEIYKDGKLSHYVDGNDAKFSNWMSCIQCARHKEEQNMTVFQYNGNLYYRAFRDIASYTELLVWYDDRYSDTMDMEAISMGGPHVSSPRTSALLQKYERGGHGRSDVDNTEQMNEVEPNDYYNIHSFNETNQWRCGQCEQSFTQRVALQMHVCGKSPERPFQCGQCPASFSHPDELRGHVVQHVSDKPFKCGFCGRTFSGSTTLSNHIRTHTGEKPFTCRKCEESFSQSTQLSRHQKSHEDCTEEVLLK